MAKEKGLSPNWRPGRICCAQQGHVSAKPEGIKQEEGTHTWAQVNQGPSAPWRTCPQLLMETIKGVLPPGVALAGQPPDATSAVLNNLEEKAISRLG